MPPINATFWNPPKGDRPVGDRLAAQELDPRPGLAALTEVDVSPGAVAGAARRRRDAIAALCRAASRGTPSATSAAIAITDIVPPPRSMKWVGDQRVTS